MFICSGKDLKLHKEKGQALVETIFILPFLFVLIIGIIEGGIVLQRQLVVVNAAREGARFGAFGATAEDIYLQTMQATSHIFEFTEEDAVIAVIHATTNEDGNGFAMWTENLYPANSPHVKPQAVLNQLGDNAANLRLVIVDVRYDHQSVLGLPIVGAFIDKVPIGSWTVMRVPAPKVGKGPGCCALPITLPIWDVEGLSKGDELIDIRIGVGSGQFGWVFWKSHKDDPSEPEPGSVPALEANLRNPCNAKDFQDSCDGSPQLGLGSWVWGDSGQMAGVLTDEEFIRKYIIGAYYPVPVWDTFKPCDQVEGCGCTPGTKVVHIVKFALMEIAEVNMTGNPKTISAKFRGWYDGCE